MKDPNYDDFCSSFSKKMLVEDFDADGRDDLLCQGENYRNRNDRWFYIDVLVPT